MTAPTYSVPARIETERLTVRRYEVSDAEQLAEVVSRNIAHLERYMEWIAFEPQSVEQRRAWIKDLNRDFDEDKDYILGVFGRDGVLVGSTGFHPRHDPDRLEIGYWIDSAHQGQGLITEAVAALTWVGLEIAGSPTVDIVQSPTNTRSAGVCERLGYIRQPQEGGACFDGGAQVPGVMWWATRDTLATEPLASTPRPTVFDANGTAIDWPSES